MSDYRLDIEFTMADLASVQLAGEKVVITRQTAGVSGPNVAWLTFAPFQNNTITWLDDYLLYVSQSMPQHGGPIVMVAQTSALEARSLPFGSGGSFGAPDPAVQLPRGAYGLQNNYAGAPYLVFGLAQQAQVSGTAVPATPVNASVVPMNQSAVFQPLDILNVFLQANTGSGTVATVTSHVLTLTFGAGVKNLAIAYNSSIGGFEIKD